MEMGAKRGASRSAFGDGRTRSFTFDHLHCLSIQDLSSVKHDEMGDSKPPGPKTVSKLLAAFDAPTLSPLPTLPTGVKRALESPDGYGSNKRRASGMPFGSQNPYTGASEDTAREFVILKVSQKTSL